MSSLVHRGFGMLIGGLLGGLGFSSFAAAQCPTPSFSIQESTALPGETITIDYCVDEAADYELRPRYALSRSRRWNGGDSPVEFSVTSCGCGSETFTVQDRGTALKFYAYRKFPPSMFPNGVTFAGSTTDVLLDASAGCLADLELKRNAKLTSKLDGSGGRIKLKGEIESPEFDLASALHGNTLTVSVREAAADTAAGVLFSSELQIQCSGRVCKGSTVQGERPAVSVRFKERRQGEWAYDLSARRADLRWSPESLLAEQLDVIVALLPQAAGDHCLTGAFEFDVKTSSRRQSLKHRPRREAVIVPKIPAIFALVDIIERNQIINATYHALDLAMMDYLGEPTLSTWVTNAKHASRQVGQNLHDLPLIFPPETAEPLVTALATGNKRVYENIATAFAAFLKAADLSPNQLPTLLQFDPITEDPRGLLAEGLDMYGLARQLGELAHVPGEPSAPSFLLLRESLVYQANIVLGYHEQLFFLQSQFDSIHAIINGLNGALFTQDPCGFFFLADNWADFESRMALAEPLPADFADVTIDTLPPIRPPADPLFRGSIPFYFLTYRSEDTCFHEPPAPLILGSS